MPENKLFQISQIGQADPVNLSSQKLQLSQQNKRIQKNIRN